MAHDALAMIEYGDKPAVFVLGDSQAAAARMVGAAVAAGCRVARSGTIEETNLAACPPGVPRLIELGGEGDKAAARALDWALAEAQHGGRPVLVSFAGPLIDLTAARAWHDGIEWLADADEGERAAAVARISRPPAARLHDIGRDEGQPILRQLTEDVGRIAAMLASLTDEEAAQLDCPDAGEGKEDAAPDAPSVRAIIRARRLRDQFFRGGLFADPAWDMLLDLMVARLEGARVSVSSLCIAAAVPPTTALRWIKALTDRGLFARSDDPEDGRRVYIALSEDAARALTGYLRAARKIAPAAI